jgi:integrase
LIRANPVDGAVLPHRPQINEAGVEVQARAMTREELSMFLRIVRPEWRLLFQFLASTGLRWGEFAALRWQDVELDGSTPHIRVPRALARPKKGEPRFKVPKSKHGLRSVPLDNSLVSTARAASGRAGD